MTAENKASLHNQKISEIYDKYHSPLKGFISKRVSSKEDSEDILQNVFYQLSKIDFEENPVEKISAWLYAVARNQIIDRSRKRREVELPHTQDSDGEGFIRSLTEMILESDSPEDEYIKAAIWEEIESALSELPDNQSEVFRLNELEGFSFKEISEATGVSIGTLISRKHYAVLHLRKRLAELYDDLLKD
ncbi:RNA polymerase sigma factor [Dysgonomonas sp. 25]|uniref:RNA polymerase sigma factor n=1 Tax=Dysgonomonas sp. 25 TaxID=2302933 RepID=UPI0013D13361|nr:sigma-70 family RNA polymerase sigma factor [Dysgonomonas sp. 25]NDV70279.1 sigma-70 family RNA polymerase sigma factor [Dysgonomonas sp. 25]